MQKAPDIVQKIDAKKTFTLSFNYSLTIIIITSLHQLEVSFCATLVRFHMLGLTDLTFKAYNPSSL